MLHCGAKARIVAQCGSIVDLPFRRVRWRFLPMWRNVAHQCAMRCARGGRGGAPLPGDRHRTGRTDRTHRRQERALLLFRGPIGPICPIRPFAYLSRPPMLFPPPLQRHCPPRMCALGSLGFSAVSAKPCGGWPCGAELLRQSDTIFPFTRGLFYQGPSSALGGIPELIKCAIRLCPTALPHV
jgi:hypothetical protein